MAVSDNKLLACLGFSITGDLGPYTTYTSRRRRIVFYPRVPALNPPSIRQLMQRGKWTTAAKEWREKSESDKQEWLRAAKRTGLMISGYGLWIFWKTKQKIEYIRTIERQSGLTLNL